MSRTDEARPIDPCQVNRSTTTDDGPSNRPRHPPRRSGDGYPERYPTSLKECRTTDPGSPTGKVHDRSLRWIVLKTLKDNQLQLHCRAGPTSIFPDLSKFPSLEPEVETAHTVSRPCDTLPSMTTSVEFFDVRRGRGQESI